MEIKGEITDIIYQNDVNSYTIAVFETEEEETTIVGYLPFVKSGDTLRVEGKFVEHKDYGRQFKVETFEKLMPETLDALEKYLANGSVKGIGEATAKKIIKTFGEDTINVFKFEPEKLAQIKGISKNKAIEMSESFLENWEVWQIVGFLERFGIGAENAKKIYDLLGINAIEQIEANPYILIDMARGVDFKQIDQMALKLGIDYDNQKRVESGIKYGLIKATYNGHSCVIKENLIEYVISLLDVTTESVEENIINLKAKEEIVVEKRDDFEWIYLENFYSVEKEIATRIIRLDKSKNVKKIEHIENALKDIEKKSSIELSDKQREAVLSINDSNVTIITGGPGTGKTTIIKTIIDLFEERKKKVVLTAPTGRAAKKMTEATGKEASTLHRLLGIGKLDDEGIYSRHSDYKGEPIDADLIVVDELSMVDMFVMNYLLNCIYQGTKLILVGDVDQLASVGPGSVLKDLINSEVINTVKLDKIFRQAAKSKIVLNAHRVNNGLGFIKNDDEEIEEDTKQDFFFIKQNSTERMLQEVISLSTGRLEKFGNYDFFKNIQILTPTKKGPLGTRELNKALQAVLNPNLEELPERKSGDIVYRVGDRVMQIKNNYDITWERETQPFGSDKINTETGEKSWSSMYLAKPKEKKEVGTGVFNGEIGTIIEIDEKEKIVKIQFDDEKVAWYEYSDLDQIEHSYAITIHKAQRK
ncbi:helicase RecD/TraA family [Clostridium sp. CAG:389]|nr:helicase RecD/TraA family [Clostridium sp. CAG:389]